MTNKYNDAKKIIRSEKAVGRIIDGEVVVLVPEEAMIHALEGCGSRIWEIIEKETTVSEITEFIENLNKLNLLETFGAAAEEVER